LIDPRYTCRQPDWSSIGQAGRPCLLPAGRFQRDLPMECGVEGKKHRAHAAAAEKTLDAVVSKHRARRQTAGGADIVHFQGGLDSAWIVRSHRLLRFFGAPATATDRRAHAVSV